MSLLHKFTQMVYAGRLLPKIVYEELSNLDSRMDDVEAGVVAAGSISETELANQAVTESKLATGAVTSGKLGAGAVTALKLGTDAVETEKIKDAAVTDDKLAGTDHSTVGADKLFKLAIGEWDSGDAVAAVVASATGIDIETEILTSTAHGFSDGDCVNATTSDTLPTGISADTAYYVHVESDNTFTLYDTRAHAIAGGATGLVNITAAGTGNQTFTSLTAIGQHYLGATLPDNALIVGGGVEVLTTLADGADDSATVAIQINGANDVVTATAISAGGNIWDAGNHDIIPDNTGSSAVKLSAERELLAVIADDQIPTGKFRVWLIYMEGI